MTNLFRKFLPAAIFILFVQSFLIAADSRSVTISYKLNKINKIASNQLAIWIEDSSGKIIRNLFVTKFTAKGGYKNREQALSGWVAKSNWKNATGNEIDTVSSATQKKGNQDITWDCKDNNGKLVPDGKYSVYFEGNIFWDKKEFAKCEIDIGSKDFISKGIITYSPVDAEKEGILFENVNVTYKSGS